MPQRRTTPGRPFPRIAARRQRAAKAEKLEVPKTDRGDAEAMPAHCALGQTSHVLAKPTHLLQFWLSPWKSSVHMLSFHNHIESACKVNCLLPLLSAPAARPTFTLTDNTRFKNSPAESPLARRETCINCFGRRDYCSLAIQSENSNTRFQSSAGNLTHQHDRPLLVAWCRSSSRIRRRCCSETRPL